MQYHITFGPKWRITGTPFSGDGAIDIEGNTVVLAGAFHKKFGLVKVILIILLLNLLIFFFLIYVLYFIEIPYAGIAMIPINHIIFYKLYKHYVMKVESLVFRKPEIRKIYLEEKKITFMAPSKDTGKLLSRSFWTFSEEDAKLIEFQLKSR
ncbi:MAG: hypothetical protein QF682_03775 [Candidatus Thermoplasmatota archaeon]|jgi:hypothetical protein|nr:hypothetical protein [Candidatus Thermoplasmatota archaeon]